MGSKSNRGNNDPSGNGARHHSLADVLRAKWKNQIKKLPPAARMKWLESQEAITALGAKTAGNLRKNLARQERALCGMACSQAWMHAWSLEGIAPHGLGVQDTTLYRKSDAGRKYSVRLRLCQGIVRYGESSGLPGDLPTAETGHRRWTPEISATTEDRYDLMSFFDAELCDDPPSISGLQFQKIGLRRGRERDQFGVNDRIVELSYVGGDEPRVFETTVAAPFDPNGTAAGIRGE